MRRPSRCWAVLGFGWLMASAATGFSQAVPPPRPDSPLEVGSMAGRMAEGARQLGRDVVGERGQDPGARDLAQQAQELAQALDEYRVAVPNTPDAFQLRRAYKGIDQNWHQLQAQLARPDVATPAVSQAAGRVAEIDAQIHQALGMNAYPANYYTGTQPPSGLSDSQRLAHALVDRAQALAAIVRADVTGGGARLLQDAVNLARATDDFHDGIDLNATPEVARNGFAGVAAMSETVRRDLDALQPIPPRVLDAWRTYLAAEVLIRRGLGLENTPQALAGTAIADNGPSPVVALTDQLLEQVNAFLQIWTPTARAVPEGAFFLADAQQLQAAAADFHNDVAQGFDAGRLAYEFRAVDLIWQRLARRTNRIARGRTGPNIQQVGKMGQTIAELHRVLGMPGYPPAFNAAPEGADGIVAP